MTPFKPSALTHIFWTLIPFLTVLIFVFLTLVPMPFMGGYIEPPLPILGVFYWAVFRPQSIPMAAIFMIGLLMDILSGFPIGAHAFIYVLVFATARRHQRLLTGQGFVVLWCAFLMVCIAHQIIIMIAAMIISKAIMAGFALMIGGIFVTVLFPVIVPFFNAVNRAMIRHYDDVTS